MKPIEQTVFVFGSNLAGRHGAGAAKYAAREHGALWGIGDGRVGNSYAIPTKDGQLRVLPLMSISRSVCAFMHYAKSFPSETFYVTALGTGLAGYSHKEIASLFDAVTSNCIMPAVWKPWVKWSGKTGEYHEWGTIGVGGRGVAERRR